MRSKCGKRRLKFHLIRSFLNSRRRKSFFLFFLIAILRFYDKRDTKRRYMLRNIDYESIKPWCTYKVLQVGTSYSYSIFNSLKLLSGT